MPPNAACGETTHGPSPFATLANDPTRRPDAARPRPTMVSPRIALGLLIVLSGCTTYELTMIPPALALQSRPPATRPDLTIAVQSTYAPYGDEDLQLGDLYPRNGRLGRMEQNRYQEAFAATQQFRSVAVGDAGNPLHCRLVILSGREPPTNRLLAGLTFGLVPTYRREILRLDATVSAPGRVPASYAIEGRILSRTQGPGDTTQPRFSNVPEQQLTAALVARMAADGWLDREEAR